jgi:hypothetical protein
MSQDHYLNCHERKKTNTPYLIQSATDLQPVQAGGDGQQIKNVKNLLTIRSKGEGYTADVILDDDGSVFFVGDADIDIDGGPNWRKDPRGQPDTK